MVDFLIQNIQAKFKVDGYSSARISVCIIFNIQNDYLNVCHVKTNIRMIRESCRSRLCWTTNLSQYFPAAKSSILCCSVWFA